MNRVPTAVAAGRVREVERAAREHEAAEPPGRERRLEPDRVRVAGVGRDQRHLRRDLRARRVAGQHDPLGVEAEPRGVRLQVRERGERLAHRRRVPVRGRERVADRDDREPLARDQPAPVRELLLGAADPAAAVDPDDRGQRPGALRPVDVEPLVGPVAVGLVQHLLDPGRNVLRERRVDGRAVGRERTAQDRRTRARADEERELPGRSRGRAREPSGATALRAQSTSSRSTTNTSGSCGWIAPPRAARAVRHRRRDRQLAAAADPHALHARVPAGNDLAACRA